MDEKKMWLSSGQELDRFEHKRELSIEEWDRLVASARLARLLVTIVNEAQPCLGEVRCACPPPTRPNVNRCRCVELEDTVDKYTLEEKT